MFKSTMILVLATGYAIVTTNYFGNNFFPNSPQECITDGIVAILFALAILAVKLRETK